ncbi:hypothetical protein E2C01_016202 [Portunus trituberculatus]|uniref:Uncharacterized protein n=1 Tax=Portunus trituberculatus TaxID=210409 RepID=A0A5B7DQC0_PORTR|nr:hypothetical protein [Portunus trituberculatus]
MQTTEPPKQISLLYIRQGTVTDTAEEAARFVGSVNTKIDPFPLPSSSRLPNVAWSSCSTPSGSASLAITPFSSTAGIRIQSSCMVSWVLNMDAGMICDNRNAYKSLRAIKSCQQFSALLCISHSIIMSHFPFLVVMLFKNKCSWAAHLFFLLHHHPCREMHSPGTGGGACCRHYCRPFLYGHLIPILILSQEI